jgi:hypothetical protein
MKEVKLVIILSALLFSCGDRIIYYGRSYPPTQQADIYFRESDVTEPNEIMGKATLEVSYKKTLTKFRKSS